MSHIFHGYSRYNESISSEKHNDDSDEDVIEEQLIPLEKKGSNIKEKVPFSGKNSYFTIKINQTDKLLYKFTVFYLL